MSIGAAKNIIQFLNGEEPKNSINKKHITSNIE